VSATQNPKVARAAEIVSDLMDEILACFKPGVKIAVIVRMPGYNDRDFMMTDDEIPELIALLERRQAQGRDRIEPAGDGAEQ